MMRLANDTSPMGTNLDASLIWWVPKTSRAIRVNAGMAFGRANEILQFLSVAARSQHQRVEPHQFGHPCRPPV